MGELTARQQAILAIVVRRFVETVKPVGSKAIVDGYGLTVSSATVRSEMALLEEEGYLAHLHASAGRVPTGKGYHYFVEQLMGEVWLSPAEQRLIRHQFYQVKMDMGEWMRLAAAVLARTVLAVSIVSPPKARQGRFKQLELIPVQGSMILLVLVLRGGVVLQRTMSLEQTVTMEELRQVSSSLTDVLAGADMVSLRAKLSTLTPGQALFTREVIDMMTGLGGRPETELYRDGLLNILSQPEYVESENARQVISIVESDRFLDSLLAEATPRGGVHILIGGEGRWDELSEFSVVLTRYGVANEAFGSLGVLGPLRMPYARAVSSVRYVAEVLSELIHQFYGVPYWSG